MVLESFTTKRPEGRLSVRLEAETCHGSCVAATSRKTAMSVLLIAPRM